MTSEETEAEMVTLAEYARRHGLNIDTVRARFYRDGDRGLRAVARMGVTEAGVAAWHVPANAPLQRSPVRSTILERRIDVLTNQFEELTQRVEDLETNIGMAEK